MSHGTCDYLFWTVAFTWLRFKSDLFLSCFILCLLPCLLSDHGNQQGQGVRVGLDFLCSPIFFFFKIATHRHNLLLTYNTHIQNHNTEHTVWSLEQVPYHPQLNLTISTREKNISSFTSFWTTGWTHQHPKHPPSLGCVRVSRDNMWGCGHSWGTEISFRVSRVIFLSCRKNKSL